MSSMTGDHFAIAYREGSFLLLALSQSLWQHRNDGIVRAMLVCGFFDVSSPSFEAYLTNQVCSGRIPHNRLAPGIAFGWTVAKLESGEGLRDGEPGAVASQTNQLGTVAIKSSSN